MAELADNNPNPERYNEDFIKEQIRKGLERRNGTVPSESEVDGAYEAWLALPAHERPNGQMLAWRGARKSEADEFYASIGSVRPDSDSDEDGPEFNLRDLQDRKNRGERLTDEEEAFLQENYGSLEPEVQNSVAMFFAQANDSDVSKLLGEAGWAVGSDVPYEALWNQVLSLFGDQLTASYFQNLGGMSAEENAARHFQDLARDPNGNAFAFIAAENIAFQQGRYVDPTEQKSYQAREYMGPMGDYTAARRLVRIAEITGVNANFLAAVVGAANRETPNEDLLSAESAPRGPLRDTLPAGPSNPVADSAKSVMGDVFSPPETPQPEKKYGITEYQWGRKVQAMQERFENPLTALVGLFDETLADRMVNDHLSLTEDDIDRILELGGGWLQNEPRMKDELGYLTSRITGQGVGGANVDPAQVRESARSLAASWNLPGIDESVIDQIVSGFNGQIRAALTAGGNSPFAKSGLPEPLITSETQSHTAFISEYLRNTDQYRTMFAGKAQTESEGEYVDRFRSDSIQMLGYEDPGAIMAGMRGGDQNSVYKYALGSQAGKDSEEFNRRMARMASTFRKYT